MGWPPSSGIRYGHDGFTRGGEYSPRACGEHEAAKSHASACRGVLDADHDAPMTTATPSMARAAEAGTPSVPIPPTGGLTSTPFARGTFTDDIDVTFRIM